MDDDSQESGGKKLCLAKPNYCGESNTAQAASWLKCSVRRSLSFKWYFFPYTNQDFAPLMGFSRT